MVDDKRDRVLIKCRLITRLDPHIHWAPMLIDAVAFAALINYHANDSRDRQTCSIEVDTHCPECVCVNTNEQNLDWWVQRQRLCLH